MKVLIIRNRVFLAVWGALIAVSIALRPPLAVAALMLPPFFQWAGRRTGPEPYDWPVWCYRLRCAAVARLGRRRNSRGGAS